MSMSLWFLVGGIVGIGLLVIAVIGRSGKRQTIRRRMTQLTQLHGSEIEEEASLFKGLRVPGRAPFLARLKGDLETRFHSVGGLEAARSLALTGLVAGAVGALAVHRLMELSVMISLLVGLPIAVFVPIFQVRRLAEKRRMAFLDSFPDAIDLIVRAIRAGIPTSESINAAGNELPQPLGGEFKRIAHEMAVGINPEQAFQEAAERIRLPDFSFFAVTLILQRETGGNLAETLENLSGLLRKRREMRLKIRALTAEGRFTSKVIAGLPVLVMFALYFLNREYITLLFTDSLGQIFLGVAVGLIIAGSIVLNKMVDLEV